MKRILYTIVVAFALATFAWAAKDTINTLPTGDASFLTDLQAWLVDEPADRDFRRFGGGVVKGGIGPTDAGLSHTITALEAFPEGYFVGQPAASHTYTNTKRTFVYVREDNARVITITGATITYDGFFVFAEMAAATEMPDTPVGLLPLMAVDTAAGAIGTVTDYREGYASVSYYGDVSDAISAIGSSMKMKLYITERVAVNEDATLTANIHLVMRGGLFDVGTGYTLTIYSPENITASLRQQIVTTTATTPIAFQRAGVVPVDWFGGTADDSTDNATAINRTYRSLSNTAPNVGGVIYFNGGVYRTGSKLNIGKNSVTIRGVQNAKSTSDYGASTVEMTAADYLFENASGVRDITFENITFAGSNTSTYGIHFDNVVNVRMDNVWITNFATGCIFADNGITRLTAVHIFCSDKLYFTEGGNNFVNFYGSSFIGGIEIEGGAQVGFYGGNFEGNDVITFGKDASTKVLGLTLDGIYLERTSASLSPNWIDLKRVTGVKISGLFANDNATDTTNLIGSTGSTSFGEIDLLYMAGGVTNAVNLTSIDGVEIGSGVYNSAVVANFRRGQAIRYYDQAILGWHTGMGSVVLGVTGAGVADGAALGRAKFTNNINYMINGKIYSKSHGDNIFDLSAATTTAGQYRKVLLGLNTAGAGKVIIGTVAATQSTAELPLRTSPYAIVGVVAVPNSYTGGDLASATFYDIIGGWID